MHWIGHIRSSFFTFLSSNIMKPDSPFWLYSINSGLIHPDENYATQWLSALQAAAHGHIIAPPRFATNISPSSPFGPSSKPLRQGRPLKSRSPGTPLTENCFISSLFANNEVKAQHHRPLTYDRYCFGLYQ